MENIKERLEIKVKELAEVEGTLEWLRNFRNKSFDNEVVGVIGCVKSALKEYALSDEQVNEILARTRTAFKMMYESYNNHVENLAALKGRLDFEVEFYKIHLK
jgi:hypothetical protein